MSPRFNLLIGSGELTCQSQIRSAQDMFFYSYIKMTQKLHWEILKFSTSFFFKLAALFDLRFQFLYYCHTKQCWVIVCECMHAYMSKILLDLWVSLQTFTCIKCKPEKCRSVKISGNYGNPTLSNFLYIKHESLRRELKIQPSRVFSDELWVRYLEMWSSMVLSVSSIFSVKR